ncbi:hypothetical protein [Streptomyces sp. NPDC048338]|uniref:hypothetical protein n=1 Tax=Streptomyces sp. NPDC048338 TaxID=3365536 RepID=UPI0037242F05
MTIAIGLLGGGLVTWSNGPGGEQRVETQGPYPAVIKWSDDGNPGQSTTVLAYASSREGGRNENTGAYELGTRLYVSCQVTGREVAVGTSYAGPLPARDTLWYRVAPTGAWIPAVYVDTGEDALPAC